VTDTLDAGIASLASHELYLGALDNHDPDAFLRDAARSAGERCGVEYATTFEVVEV
jgi:hypothetical protein